MNVVAIIGSPNHDKNTYKTVQEFEQKLDKLVDTNFTYIYLKYAHLEQCVGCGICLTKGEEYCPLTKNNMGKNSIVNNNIFHRDDRDKIFDLMMCSDGIIFASPNYSLQVSALMKNFLDRFAYILHRPCFFRKSFIPIIVQGYFGYEDILEYLEKVGHYWGFKTCKGLGITVSQFHDEQIKNSVKIEKAAERFNKMLKSSDPVPTIKDLVTFRFARSIKPYIAEDSPRDYEYWKNRGWLESDYFYDTKLGLTKRIIGRWADRKAIQLGKDIQRRKEEMHEQM